MFPQHADNLVSDSPSIVIEGLSKVYTGSHGQRIEALQDVDLTVEDGEFVCLVGPSGCGKSTLLNTIAGFETPTSGHCRLDGKEIRRPSPERGVVFQEYGIFPWMTVSKNVDFGLKMARLSRSRRSEIVSRVLRLVGLQGFENEFPKALSGGMKQRVAIARILALNPRVMLMDEPFGALDALTRSTLQRELEEIWQRERPAVVFVTHNVEESVLLGDKVVLMSPHPGRIRAVVKIALTRPRNPTDPDFNVLREQLTTLLMGDSPTQRPGSATARDVPVAL